jgi:hypothetical protein
MSVAFAVGDSTGRMVTPGSDVDEGGVAAPDLDDVYRAEIHNAGRTWTNLHTPVSIDGLSIDFVTTQIGWAFTTIPVGTAGAEGLLQPTDGGHTWTAVTATISGA